MDPKPLISLIIPTYNRASLLAEALRSVMAQEFTDFELIVVDDGSTDDTAALLEKEADNPQWAGRLRALRQANAGQGTARNAGIERARGEYCAFLDSDDLFLPWTLSSAAQAITRHDNPPVIYGKQTSFRAAQEHLSIRGEPLRTSVWPDLYTHISQNQMLEDHVGCPGALVARTELLREVGGFLADRVVGEDADLLYRLGIYGPMVRIEAPVTLAYRHHPEQFTTNFDSWYRGARSLMRRCSDGVFPGGEARAAEVRKLIAAEIKLFTFICLYEGGRGTWISAKIYLRSLVLQLRAGNFAHVLKLPVCLGLRMIGRWPLQAKYRDQWRHDLPAAPATFFSAHSGEVPVNWGAWRF